MEISVPVTRLIDIVRPARSSGASLQCEGSPKSVWTRKVASGLCQGIIGDVTMIFFEPYRGDWSQLYVCLWDLGLTEPLERWNE